LNAYKIRIAGTCHENTAGKEVLKSFTIGNTGRLNPLNLSPTIWQVVLEASTAHPEVPNAIYLEATA
jgi:hypothetical protein